MAGFSSKIWAKFPIKIAWCPSIAIWLELRVVKRSIWRGRTCRVARYLARLPTKWSRDQSKGHSKTHYLSQSTLVTLIARWKVLKASMGYKVIGKFWKLVFKQWWTSICKIKICSNANSSQMKKKRFWILGSVILVLEHVRWQLLSFWESTNSYKRLQSRDN